MLFPSTYVDQKHNTGLEGTDLHKPCNMGADATAQQRCHTPHLAPQGAVQSDLYLVYSVIFQMFHLYTCSNISS